MTGTVRDNLGKATEMGAFLFEALIDSNVVSSRRSDPPASFARALTVYARDNPRDGRVLLAGQERDPVCYTGGWILSVVRGAEAITLDRQVFSRTPLTLSTYIHEVVHVGQYGNLGITPFLVTYFTESALEVLRRLRRGDALDVMQSNRLEDEAYDIEFRFRNWLRQKSGMAAGSLRGV